MENEVISQLNLKEKIIARLFRKTTFKLCNITRIYIVNNFLKS